MPRIRLPGPSAASGHHHLVERLAEELKSEHESGQPMILEEVLGKTNSLRVTVVWDAWANLDLEERADVIQQAYASLGDKDALRQLTLAVGMTVPEAADEGRLPYQIVTLLRKSDPVTLEQCQDAMLHEGGSTLRNPNAIELRFPTMEAAELCISRLEKALPGSGDVWGISEQNVNLVNREISQR